MAWRPSDTQYRVYDVKSIETLAALYKAAAEDLTKTLSQASLTKFQKYRAKELLAQVNATIAELNAKTYRWVGKTVKGNYESGVEFAEERLRKGKVVRSVNYDAVIHKTAVETLADDMNVELLSMSASMQKVAERYIRKTQQTVLQDREISRTIAKGVIEGATRRTTSDRLYAQLSEKVKAGDFLTINGRNYNPGKYAEMVARTRQREASSLGVINTSLQYGVDLVQVSVHADVDGADICNEHEGKIYSISGTSGRYPQLSVYPPFHPNCRHVLLPLVVDPADKKGALA